MKRSSPSASPVLHASSLASTSSSNKRSRGDNEAQLHPPASTSDEASTSSGLPSLHAPSLTAPLKTPAFQKPACIATFSYDENRGLHHDNQSLGVYHPPPPPQFNRDADRGRGRVCGPDLKYGYERWKRRDETVDEHLDSLLIALQHKANLADPEGDQDRDRARADVITWRGIATKLCTTIFAENDYDSWQLNVLQLGPTLYLEEFVPPKTRSQKAESTDQRQLGFMYSGYAFESWCVSPAIPDTDAKAAAMDDRGEREPPPPPGWGGTINNNVQWCAICKTTLGSNRLIIGGEVDCIQPSALSKFPASSALLNASTLNPDDFVELKTSAEIRNERDAERFEGTKMLRFYFQSFLLGVPTIVTGFRDRAGFLADVQSIPTLNLPRIVRGRNPDLEAGKGLAFADQTLQWIRDCISRDTQTTTSAPPDVEEAERSFPVFRISFSPSASGAPRGVSNHNSRGGSLSIRRLTDAEVREDIKGGTDQGRVGFLPSSFYTFAREKLGTSAGI
ncbi:unnamed protein product [Tilletia controversa]|uniref:Decapping nuclease n=3 Tax=Tilletia TaxID=13289 RepID=A0A8X7N1M9_9BASI|nr:hypothetical protein CF336_g443 [Tilletia laevis]KAE8205588.1 hypothetical protein CF328_g408 [Tilletia controversa]KAE8265452.1 hypothetical protein A4X03_0g255 [Tilletia caries]KAE8208766.1 hypothetical protein CF335_g173 [Tilletia laevis]KAE8255273.1 hypothetical protein A4X06_0g504 [Tilletia controversa]